MGPGYLRMLLQPLDAKVLSALQGGGWKRRPWLVPAFKNAPASVMACISETHSEHSEFHLYIAVAVPDPDQRGQKI